MAAHAASIVYTYQGNLFNDTAQITNPCQPNTGGCAISAITATLEFSTALASNLSLQSVTPDAWSISDGLTTITNATPNVVFVTALQVGTDGSGNIDEWIFDIVPTSPGSVPAGAWSELRTRNVTGFAEDDLTRYCQAGSCSNQGVAFVLNSAGSWTVSTVPVPAALLMFAPALAGLLVLRRYRTD